MPISYCRVFPRQLNKWKIPTKYVNHDNTRDDYLIFTLFQLPMNPNNTFQKTNETRSPNSQSSFPIQYAYTFATSELRRLIDLPSRYKQIPICRH